VSDFEEPGLHVIKFPPEAGAEWRAQAQQHRAEARDRYVAHLASVSADAAAVLDALTTWNDITTGEPCICGCHPRLPGSDFHDYGFACSCRSTPAERARQTDAWMTELDEFWASPEGMRLTAEREADKAELTSWLAGDGGVSIRSYGGSAPEQWWGAVDGHSFYFRERHGVWRIELDLRPSGQFMNVWLGGDMDDDASFEQREIETGDIIAEGTTTVAGYGVFPVERVRFIVNVIRGHLARQRCTVHSDDRHALEVLWARPLAWCPACGTSLSP